MPKFKISFSNISSLLLAILIVAMIINPNVKAFMIQGLMKVGLFKPHTHSAIKSPVSKNYDLNFIDKNQKLIKYNDLNGKVVFINFWATWCPPCVAELPSINQLYKKYKNRKEIVFILVDADNDLNKSIAFINKKNFDLPVYKYQGNIPPEWYSGSLPTTIVLDKNGNLIYKQEGAANYDDKDFQIMIDKLLQ